jgi:hypothetical protein
VLPQPGVPAGPLSRFPLIWSSGFHLRKDTPEAIEEVDEGSVEQVS